MLQTLARIAALAALLSPLPARADAAWFASGVASTGSILAANIDQVTLTRGAGAAFIEQAVAPSTAPMSAPATVPADQFGNTSLIERLAFDNTATVLQTGMLNTSVIVQSGSGNDCTVIQSSNGNISTVTQTGTGGLVSVHQG